MKAHWLIPGKFDDISILSNSMLASIRLRSNICSDYLTRSNFFVTAGDFPGSDIDILFIGKIGADCSLGRSQLWKDTIKRHSENSLIILDYTDNHLATPFSPMGQFYSDILYSLDGSTASSYFLAKALNTYWPGEVNVIEDPIDVPIIAKIKYSQNETPTILWFGHSSNIIYLINFLENNLSKNITFNLLLLSNLDGLKLFFGHTLKIQANISISAAEWSTANMISAASECDACIIPSNPSDSRKAGASSNRLITAFALGLPTAASNLSSYLPFQDYYFSLESGDFDFFLSNLTKYRKEVAFAQKRVVPLFSTEMLGNKWCTVVDKFLTLKK